MPTKSGQGFFLTVSALCSSNSGKINCYGHNFSGPQSKNFIFFLYADLVFNSSYCVAFREYNIADILEVFLDITCILFANANWLNTD